MRNKKREKGKKETPIVVYANETIRKPQDEEELEW